MNVSGIIDPSSSTSQLPYHSIARMLTAVIISVAGVKTRRQRSFFTHARYWPRVSLRKRSSSHASAPDVFTSRIPLTVSCRCDTVSPMASSTRSTPLRSRFRSRAHSPSMGGMKRAATRVSFHDNPSITSSATIACITSHISLARLLVARLRICYTSLVTRLMICPARVR